MVFAFLPEFREKSTCIYTNLLIGIFNLIPIYPLDGGRAVDAVLKMFLKTNVTEELVHRISNISLIVLSIFAAIRSYIFKKYCNSCNRYIFVGYSYFRK